MGNKAKGDLEQIFTPPKLTNYLIDNFLKYEGEITEILEPSAGSGKILDEIKKRFDVPTIQYDIEPQRSDIIEANFLDKKFDLNYKKGRITIMNPPFTKGLKFIYKALEVSDYVLGIFSSTSFMNIDYKKYYVDEIHLIKKAEFSNGKSYPICMLGIRKKDVEVDDEFWV